MSALDDIEKLLAAMRDRGAEMKAFEGLLKTIETATADIVQLLEKDPEKQEQIDLSPLVDAIKGMNLAPAITVSAPEVKAPDVIVKVPAQSAPTIDLAPVITAVQGLQSWTQLKIEVDRGQYGNGPAQSYTITKIK